MPIAACVGSRLRQTLDGLSDRGSKSPQRSAIIRGMHASHSSHGFCLVAGLVLLTAGCGQPSDPPHPVAASPPPAASIADPRLEDGVYPVVPPDEPPPQGMNESEVVTLAQLTTGDEEELSSLRIVNRPLIRLRHVPAFDFDFEGDVCTRIGFETTDEFRKYTRDHIGRQLAIVVDGQVITQHKIRMPIEGKSVQITCCIAGTADRLRKALTEIKVVAPVESSPSAAD